MLLLFETSLSQYYYSYKTQNPIKSETNKRLITITMITLSGFHCTTVITDLLLSLVIVIVNSSLVIVFETKYAKKLVFGVANKNAA